MDLKHIIDLLQQNDDIIIFPHVNPDGDCLGSSIALAMSLTNIGKKARVIVEENVPSAYEFLPGLKYLEMYKEDKSNGQLAAAIDTGDRKRLGERVRLFDRCKFTMNIDHHKTNTSFADYNFVDASKSSAGEIIFDILKSMNVKIDKSIAVCLYVAIATDTGGFRYSNTTADTHRTAAKLMEYGLNAGELSSRLFDVVSKSKVLLTAEVIKTLETFSGGKIAFLEVNDKILESAGAVPGDCDGLVNIGRNIEGVEVAVLLKEIGNNEIKVNMRSNKYADVASIAGFFSGGGHARAAGCTIYSHMKKAKSMLLAKVREVVE